MPPLPSSSLPRTTAATNFPIFLWTFGLTALLLLTTVVTLNYRIDPYFLHQWDSPLLKRMSPAQPKLSPWIKTYAAYRYQPDVVFLGSSRTEIGLPVDLAFFSGKIKHPQASFDFNGEIDMPRCINNIYLKIGRAHV